MVKLWETCFNITFQLTEDHKCEGLKNKNLKWHWKVWPGWTLVWWNTQSSRVQFILSLVLKNSLSVHAVLIVCTFNIFTMHLSSVLNPKDERIKDEGHNNRHDNLKTKKLTLSSSSTKRHKSLIEEFSRSCLFDWCYMPYYFTCSTAAVFMVKGDRANIQINHFMNKLILELKS